jgi:ribonuclease D
VTEFVELGDSARLTQALSSYSVIGLDTEFMREKTFFAQLCLIQIATPDNIYCVDPLAGGDIEPFWNSLMDRSWVLHSGRQDLEVLYAAADRMPSSIFDTQVAAGLAGFAPQIGYAGLVAELCDVRLEKSHTRADWSKRPLPAAFIEYAAEDVAYLLPIFELLREKLDRLGRLEWAQEDSADLLDVRLYQVDPAMAVQRLKGAANLRGPARAAAVGLAAWREREALKRNRPRQWILRDPVLMELAVARPETPQSVAATPGLAARTAQRYGQRFLDIVREAEQKGSTYEPPPRTDAGQRLRLKEAQALVTTRAAELGIAPEVLAPKKDLSAALGGNGQARIFRGWRRAVVGEELRSLFDSAG